MVGDSRFDMLAARAAGVTSAGATWGFYGVDALREHAPDYLLTAPDELLPIVL